MAQVAPTPSLTTLQDLRIKVLSPRTLSTTLRYEIAQATLTCVTSQSQPIIPRYKMVKNMVLTNGVLLHNTPIYTHTALIQVGPHYGNTGKLSHNTLKQAQTTSIEDGLHCGASGTLSHNIPIQTHTTTPLLGQQVDLKVLHGFKAYQCIERSLLGLEGMMGKM
jgi:hypothetical protein